MFKWVAGLCALMYLVLLTAGEPTDDERAARIVTSNQNDTRDATPQIDIPAVQAAAHIQEPPPVAAPTLEVIESPVLVSAQADTTEPAVAAPVSVEQIELAAPTVVREPAAADIRSVTGRRVNLREGPSTTTGIVGRAVRDDSAEVIEVLPSGWAKVYILETGIEAYISAQFLSDAG